jgi:hypothetical protein
MRRASAMSSSARRRSFSESIYPNNAQGAKTEAGTDLRKNWATEAPRACAHYNQYRDADGAVAPKGLKLPPRRGPLAAIRLDRACRPSDTPDATRPLGPVGAPSAGRSSKTISIRKLCGIDIDFVVVVGQSLRSSIFSRPGRRDAAGGSHLGRLYISVAVTWKKGGRQPLGFSS